MDGPGWALELLARNDVVRVRAGNPGPLTLSGTNSWVVGRDPAWVIDPGPALDAHLDALIGTLSERGGLGGIALTHDHPDHSEAVGPLRERAAAAAAVGAVRKRVAAAPVAAAIGAVDRPLSDGDRAGPLRVLATPGHAPGHLAYVLGDAIGFSGDAVLGAGSSLVIPAPGALAAQLDSLERLRGLRLSVICPGHGPLVTDPDAKLDAYIAHRREREQLVLAALEGGCRTIDELLASAWSDTPEPLRPAAAITLASHLDKLADEGRLPEGVERPRWP